MLREVLRGAIVLSGENPPVAEIEKAMRASIVPELGGKHSHSSAMHPLASTFWCIGIFGSVWLDNDIDNAIWRIGWAGQNNFTAEKMVYGN